MRQLATHNCTIRGILRQAPQSYPVPPQDRPARVSYALVDHASEDQLSRAFAGVDAVFLLIGTHPAQVQTESRMIAAAQRAGVRRIIKLSAPLVAAPASVEAANWHRAVEAKLAASGLEFCCLRPYAFMQNWLRNTYTIKRFGAIIGSAGVAPRNYVDCRDVAAIATRLLLSEQLPHTDAITITGPEVISNQEMVERISLATGATVRYTNLSRSDHYRMLVTQAQVPEWLAQHIVELEELAIRIPEQATNSVAAFLDRPARTMDSFLHEHRSAFMQKKSPIPI
jgi:uncharacterized protein YbjT (DUF2867 family)